MEYQLELKHIAKSYNDIVAVDDVSLQVRKGEIISLLGASGCGKTTTLRMIAGLIRPTRGQVFIEGQDMTDVPPYKRDLSMVFQNYALFPHMTVFENIVYGLRMRGIKDKGVLRERANEMMRIVQLKDVDNRLPRELSGGQQQRVSLARAMIVEPKVMLFDEPLSNLDAKLREQTRIEIRSLLRNMNMTAIYVTHDQEEALTISDRIAVMHKGCIEQITEPKELYTRPETRYIAGFVGHANILSGKVESVSGNRVVIRSDKGNVFTAVVPDDRIPAAGEDTTLVIRPENVRPAADDEQGPNVFTAEVRNIIYLGARIRFELDIGEDRKFEMDLTADEGEVLVSGGRIKIVCAEDKLILVS